MKLPKQSKIRWRQGDYIKLGKAVAEFNRTKNELQTEENKLYLPETINYNDIKSGIYSRSELNRIIKSLRSFNEKNAEIVKEGDIQITKWERRENMLAQKRAIRNLERDISELNQPITSEGYSRAQMGSIELRQLQRSLESIKNYKEKTGENYQRTLRRIKSIGTNDYNMKKANIYRENVMNELEDLKKSIPEFADVYNYFNKITNPITFYNTMQQSQVLQDFFVWYEPDIQYANYKDHKEIAEAIINIYKIVN